MLCGALPLIVYNALNQVRGLYTYRGSVLTYLISPKPLSERLAFFQSHTLPMAWGFSDMKEFFRAPAPSYPHHAAFDAIFWVLAGAALAFPLVYRVVCWRRGEPAVVTARTRGFDAVAVWFVIVTMAIILISAHPV